MKYVTVLDFEKGKIDIYPYEDSIEDVEDLIVAKGHNTSNCEWLCLDELNLEIHTSE